MHLVSQLASFCHLKLSKNRDRKYNAVTFEPRDLLTGLGNFRRLDASYGFVFYGLPRVFN